MNNKHFQKEHLFNLTAARSCFTVKISCKLAKPANKLIVLTRYLNSAWFKVAVDV